MQTNVGKLKYFREYVEVTTLSMIMSMITFENKVINVIVTDKWSI